MNGFAEARVKVKQGWLQGYTAGRVKIFKGIPTRRRLWEKGVFESHRIPAGGAAFAGRWNIALQRYSR